jgi:hypothetical protein
MRKRVRVLLVLLVLLNRVRRKLHASRQVGRGHHVRRHIRAGRVSLLGSRRPARDLAHLLLPSPWICALARRRGDHLRGMVDRGARYSLWPLLLLLSVRMTVLLLWRMVLLLTMTVVGLRVRVLTVLHRRRVVTGGGWVASSQVVVSKGSQSSKGGQSRGPKGTFSQTSKASYKEGEAKQAVRASCFTYGKSKQREARSTPTSKTSNGERRRASRPTPHSTLFFDLRPLVSAPRLDLYTFVLSWPPRS